jgi:geranylgeranyl pyrophosphate synthase
LPPVPSKPHASPAEKESLHPTADRRDGGPHFHPPASAHAGAASDPQASPTDHLKIVPAARAERERIRQRAFELASQCDRGRPLGRHWIESQARTILTELQLPESYLGWAMVAVSSAFWREQVETIPFQRRLLLLPHCLRNSATCPAEYNEEGLLCRECGACRLSEFRATARQKGYQVLIAEGSPAVIDIILRGEADAILGAACLNSLEKAFGKILLAGIPCMAVPLLHNSCRDTTTDEDWVREMIDTPHRSGKPAAPTYMHLLRQARRMFEPDELRRLLPRVRTGSEADAANGHPRDDADPMAVTETIAHDFLQRGGKHLRPFITLAAYDAMRGGTAVGPEGSVCAARLSDPVYRIALAIEVFHKASLVHDDIEDDDPFRYGRPTLHRKHGVPAAINVGDYLIGLGYRLVAEQRQWLSTEAVADILGRLAEAHIKLCEGQGAELAWRESAHKALPPLETLKIYALKTAPAFEAALYAGLRLAGPVVVERETVARLARHLGVAFQILNDLDDWAGEQPNKRTRGGDALGRRPTVLWALALENLDPEGRRELEMLVARPPDPSAPVVDAVRQLYERAGVFEQARALVAKHRQRAHEIAATILPPPLAQLLHYLADTVLEG